MTAQIETQAEPAAAPTDKLSGPPAAAIVAAGIGALVMGLMVTLNEASTKIKDLTGFDLSAFLQFDKNYGIGSGVGPLSGKVILSLLAYFISWAILFALWRRRDINVRKAFIATLILVGVGFLLTFPPIFRLVG